MTQEPGQESTAGIPETEGENAVPDRGPIQSSPGSSFTPGQRASMMSKVLVVCFSTALVIGGMYIASDDGGSSLLHNDRPGFDQEVNRNMVLGYMTPFLAPGVNKPNVRTAEKTRFADGTPVVGVSVGNAHRAYPPVVMQGFGYDGVYGGIVNDTVGGELITLINDLDAKLVRVFTPSEKSDRKVARLRLAGMADGGAMMVTFDNVDYYRQDSLAIPSLKDYAFKEVTWSEWKAAHPESDVYVGTFVTPDLQMEVSLAFMTPKERAVAEKAIAKRNRDAKVLSPNRKKPRSRQADDAQTSPPAAGKLDAKPAQPEKKAGQGAAGDRDSTAGSEKSSTRVNE